MYAHLNEDGRNRLAARLLLTLHTALFACAFSDPSLHTRHVRFVYQVHIVLKYNNARKVALHACRRLNANIDAAWLGPILQRQIALRARTRAPRRRHARVCRRKQTFTVHGPDLRRSRRVFVVWLCSNNFRLSLGNMEFDQGWQLHEYEHTAQTPKCTMAAPLTLVKDNVRTKYFLQSARPAHTALQHAPRVLPLANVIQASVLKHTRVIGSSLHSSQVACMTGR